MIGANRVRQAAGFVEHVAEIEISQRIAWIDLDGFAVEALSLRVIMAIVKKRAQVDIGSGVRGIEFMQVASAPSLGNVEAGVVASATSIRFSVASGGILCVVGTLVSAALFPALLRYDAKRHAAEA